jgi:poly(A) polymerase
LKPPLSLYTNGMTPLDAATSIINKLKSHGYEAYLVGGCVRDLLLQRKPKDFDVTTNAVPEEVQAIFEKTIPVGAAFGVVIVVEGDHQIEVATFRADGTYSDGRRPDSVAYSKSAKEDVIRRDFTINGLLCTGEFPFASKEFYDQVADGASIFTVGDKTIGIRDHVGGKADLDRGVIRCIGNPEDRFAEDALRMLRAVRFAAQLGFEIEKNTEAAICKMANTISKISKERIAAELFKLVSAPFPVKGLVPLVTTGLANNVAYVLSYHGNFAETLRQFAAFPTTDPLKGIAMLLDNTDRELAYNFLLELKLSNEQIEIIEGGLKDIGDLDCMDLSQLKKLARRTGIQIALDLFEQTVALNGGGMNPDFEEAIRKLRNFTPEEIQPKPLATGDDLIAMGCKPGPAFTKLLGALEIEQLNGTVTTHEQAVTFLTEQVEA